MSAIDQHRSILITLATDQHGSIPITLATDQHGSTLITLATDRHGSTPVMLATDRHRLIPITWATDKHRLTPITSRAKALRYASGREPRCRVVDRRDLCLARLTRKTGKRAGGGPPRVAEEYADGVAANPRDDQSAHRGSGAPEATRHRKACAGSAFPRATAAGAARHHPKDACRAPSRPGLKPCATLPGAGRATGLWIGATCGNHRARYGCFTSQV